MDPQKEKKHIFLIGFMGSGKSTIAKKLAKKLSARRVEMDECIEEEQGMPITEIFATKGEPYFREAETDFLRRLSEGERCVVSCGGGVAMRQENVAIMRESGTIVLLDAAPETIYYRVKDSTDRPLLNGHMNIDYIASLMEKRAPFYQKAADLTVSTNKKSAAAITDEIVQRVCQ